MDYCYDCEPTVHFADEVLIDYELIRIFDWNYEVFSVEQRQ